MPYLIVIVARAILIQQIAFIFARVKYCCEKDLQVHLHYLSKESSSFRKQTYQTKEEENIHLLQSVTLIIA